MGEVLLGRYLLFVGEAPSAAAFQQSIRPWSIQADLAHSSAEALELAEVRPYPIVVADLGLLGDGGFDLLEQIAERSSETTFVLLADNPRQQFPSKASVDGRIVSILSKPWDCEELTGTLQRAFGLSQRRSQRPVAMLEQGLAELAVLLVEDNPDDAYVFGRELRQASGRPPRHAARLSDALQLLQKEHFDVVVTDLSLPDARGFDAVTRLQEAAPETTIVVWTGVDDEALALQLVESGAQDCLIKGRLDGAGMMRALRQARERQRCTQRLSRLARTDTVTGLANRNGFNDRVQQALNRARRKRGSLAVMLIDLDGFKAVNDRFGHSTGDEVLREIGVQLSRAVRDYDAVARLGGDEFALLIDELADPCDPAEFAERVVAVFQQPILLERLSHRITASVGVAVFPEAGSGIAQLIEAADQAMYVAKRAGGSRYRVARREYDASLARQL